MICQVCGKRPSTLRVKHHQSTLPTQRATKGIFVGFDLLLVILSIGAPLFPYDIAYRRVCGLSTTELFKKSSVARCAVRQSKKRREAHENGGRAERNG